MAPPQPVPIADSPRRLLKDVAYEQLKQLIVSGAYPPGTFLSERQLASRLGMSKTPIRTALERLDSQGFITISPQQGIIVREPSIHEIADQFEIRVALETHVARSLAGRLHDWQQNELMTQLAAQEIAADRGDVDHCVQLDLEFHLMLCQFLGNREILDVMYRLRDKTLRVITHVMQDNPGRVRANYQEHRSIVDAIQAKDGPLAAERVQRHLEYGRDFLVSRGRGQ